jgi:hypothetical protein
MADAFGGHAVGRSDPCPNAKLVVPSDTVANDPPFRCIYPDADGTVKLTLATSATPITIALTKNVVPPFSGITHVWTTPTPPVLTGGW